MALLLTTNTASGYTAAYWRIERISNPQIVNGEPGMCGTITLSVWKDQQTRDAAKVNGNYQPASVHSISIDSPIASIVAGYDYLKLLPEFAGAQDA